MFLAISTIVICASWSIGAVMLVLNAIGCTSVAGWIVACLFWCPYAVFMLVFCGLLVYHVATDPGGWKRGWRREE